MVEILTGHLRILLFLWLVFSRKEAVSTTTTWYFSLSSFRLSNKFLTKKFTSNYLFRTVQLHCDYVVYSSLVSWWNKFWSHSRRTFYCNKLWLWSTNWWVRWGVYICQSKISFFFFLKLNISLYFIPHVAFIICLMVPNLASRST